MIKPECILSGKNFDPIKLTKKITDVKIEKIITTGETGKMGRYEGKPTPYGFCRITTPDDIPGEDRIKWMTTLIARHISTFRATGATGIELCVHWTGDQGNMEFSAGELKSIADLGISMTICYIFSEDGGLAHRKTI